MKKLAAIASTLLLFSFTLTACSQQHEAKTPTIGVTYSLQESKKNVAKKQVKVKKNATILEGLKKAWPVKMGKGAKNSDMVVSINGKKQNPKQSIYWTYTLNGKYANKGIEQQKLHNKDKVKFTLAKMK